MNLNRFSKGEGLKELEDFFSSQKDLSKEELIERKLVQLEHFVRQLADTSNGRAELDGRRTRFGECVRARGETAAEFYGRLRWWLDR